LGKPALDILAQALLIDDLRIGCSELASNRAKLRFQV
jgi:hypothetical protein